MILILKSAHIGSFEKKINLLYLIHDLEPNNNLKKKKIAQEDKKKMVVKRKIKNIKRKRKIGQMEINDLEMFIKKQSTS